MKNFIPYIFVFLNGYLLLHVCYKRNLSRISPLEAIIAFWLGICCCVAVTFYSFLFVNHYDALIIKLLSFFLLLIFFCIYCARPNKFFKSRGTNTSFTNKYLSFGILALISILLMFGISNYQPFGDWDAWSFWNFRARYFLNAGSHWCDVCFLGTIQGEHGWFLPLWNVFGWTWSGGESNVFPRLSSQVFGLILFATVFFGLLELTSRRILAFLGTLWLVSIPYFISHTVSQYADVVIAGIFVITLLYLLKMNKKVFKADVIVFALLLGFMTFIKDEGIISCLIIVILFLSIIKPSRIFLVPFFFALAIALFPTILVKYLVKAVVVPGNSISFLHLFNLTLWWQVIKYFLELLVSQIFGGIIIVPILLLLFRITFFWDKEASLMGRFLVNFIAIYFFLYVLLADNLSWRLLATGSRLVYVVLPASIMLLFYSVSLMRGKNG